MSVNDANLLVVGERGDWLTVIPIVVPVEVALQHLADLWDNFSRDLGSYARLGKRTAEGDNLAEYDPRNDAKIFDSVVGAARVGPITDGKGTTEEMWALRRQGDMLYLVSGPRGLSPVAGSHGEDCGLYVKCAQPRWKMLRMGFSIKGISLLLAAQLNEISLPVRIWWAA